MCKNSDGSYDCECSDGYTKSDNGDCQGKYIKENRFHLNGPILL